MNSRVKWSVLILFVFIIHLSYLSNNFVWLDHLDIEEGIALVPLQRFYDAFSRNYADTGFYRPLVTIVHSVNSYLYGNNATGYHLTNIVLHLVVSWVAVVFINCFTKLKKTEKYFVFLVVGVHSISWFTVGAIAHLPELLMALFVMATVICYVKGKSYWVIGITYFLAIISKETSLFYIPAFIGLWSFTTLKAKLKREYLLSLIAVLVVYLIARVSFLPQIWKISAINLPLSQSIGTRLSVLGRLAYNLIIPTILPISDTVSIVSLVNWQAIITLVVIVILAFIIWKKGIRYHLSKSFLMLAIALAPTLNIVPLARFYSINYAYFAVIPLAYFIVCVLRIIHLKNKKVYSLSLLILVFWIMLMSYATYKAGFRFKDDKQLFLTEVDRDAKFLEGHFYLGNYYFMQKNMDLAENHYLAALKADPTFIAYVDKKAAMINLAGIYLSKNQLSSAEELLNKSVIGATKRQSAQIAYNKALIYARGGDADKVIDILDPYVKESLDTNLLLLWSDASVRLNKKGLAVELLQKKSSELKISDSQRLQEWLDVNK